MLSNESKIIETVCPQLAESLALNCAKISQVEMDLKSLQRKMSTRKERGEKKGVGSKSQSGKAGRDTSRGQRTGVITK